MTNSGKEKENEIKNEKQFESGKMKESNIDVENKQELEEKKENKGKHENLSERKKTEKTAVEFEFSYAYFPGCSSKSNSVEYHISALKVAEKLGIELLELEDANCCGTHNVEDYSEEFWLALNARNIVLAEDIERDIVCICSGCFLNTKKAKKMLEDKQRRDAINKILNEIDRSYSGKIEIRHILDIIVNDYGLKRLRESVTNELELRVAPYYGCQLLRPPEITEFEDPENPKSFENLLEVIGCEVADYPSKTDCCGATLTLVDNRFVDEMVGRILEDVRKVGADCISTICPLCQYALESTQFKLKDEPRIPVLHFTQLVGLAIGLSPEELALDKNLIPADKLVKTVLLKI